MSQTIHEAVTVVLVNDGNIFVTHRHPALLAFPGYHAFPGGRVDKEDATGPDVDHALFAGHNPRLMRALARELREELGFDLVAAAERGLVQEIVDIGRAITPAGHPRRFDTHFFRVALNQRPAFELDTREAVTGVWDTPAAWAREYRTGGLLLARPTRVVFEALERDVHCGHIEGLTPSGILDGRSINEPIFGVGVLPVSSNTLPPADHTNCFIIGDADAVRIAVDPSPRDASVLDTVCARLEALQVTEIFITHHHPDHHELADSVARRLGLPIAMSRDTEQRIRERWGSGFFDGVTLKHYGDGDTVTQWLGHNVRALAVPGHDQGQLALMPDNAAWCIVGDLIQGVGTVVISKPEGNMKRYYASLERVIALAPRAIFPSHGIAMGSTHRLEETLKHRRLREEQVFELHQQGQSIDQILPQLYRDIDPRLLPLARRNIESHLDKLREDGRIAA